MMHICMYRVNAVCVCVFVGGCGCLCVCVCVRERERERERICVCSHVTQTLCQNAHTHTDAYIGISMYIHTYEPILKPTPIFGISLGLLSAWTCQQQQMSKRRRCVWTAADTPTRFAKAMVAGATIGSCTSRVAPGMSV